MNKKEIKAEALLTTNPFAGDDFEIPVSIDKRKASATPGQAAPKSPFDVIDRERHMKVFVSEKKRNQIMNLSERAKSMILFIQYYTPQRKDFIELTAGRYTKETGVRSRVTFTLARTELIDKNIIVQSSIPGVYWINPRYLFPGSRPAHYPNNTTKGTSTPE